MADFNILVGVQSGDAIQKLKDVENKIRGVGNQTKKTNDQLRNHANQYNKTAVAANKFGKGLAQQAGYQVADFAVQLQNGTSFLQAFGQQGSQMLAVFGPVGSVLGAVVAVGAALGTVFTKAAGSTRDFKNEIKDLNKEIDLLLAGAETPGEFALIQAIDTAQAKLKEANSELDDFLENTKDIKIDENAVNDVLADQLRSLRNEVAAKAHLVDLAKQELDDLRETRDRKQQLVDATKAQEIAEQAIIDMMNIQHDLQKQIADEQLSRLQQSDLMVRQFYANQMSEEDKLNKKRTTAFSRTMQSLQAQSSLLSTEITLRKEYTNEQYIQERLEQKRVALLGQANGLTANQIQQQVALTASIQTQRQELEYIVALEEMRQRAVAGGLGRMGGPTASELVRNDPQVQLAYEQMRLFDEKYKKEREAAEKARKAAKDTAIAFRGINPELQRLENLATSVGSSFENAFMSAIDGTKSAKDAFRAMAADIIKELYRVFVVKQITGFIQGLVMDIGGRPVQGPQLPGRASGGPVSANTPYLVGERGPELMIPRTSGTVVPNNKLGGGGVVVNQTINVSTGVQQTVRTEIKSLMPQIAESAKSAVMDAKRRGGSYGRSFA